MESNNDAAGWVRVADLRPQLRKHVKIYSQVYRDERWFVFHDTANGNHLRINESAHAFVARLDGDLTVKDIWQIVEIELGENAPGQDDIIIILTKLFATDLLRSSLPIDAKEFFKRYQTNKNLRTRKAFMNPLAIRIPLFDPDQLLNKLMFFVRPIFSRTGIFLWSLIVCSAALLALINSRQLGAAIQPDILAADNLVLMLLLYCLIKIVHEFAHGFAAKMWGGEVHEMGITLLVLIPVPYVDATSAWAIRNKYKRMVVSAAGIVVELFLAALALFIWLLVEPGLLKDSALNIMLIGTVSTLLFNANPLLRFDGYFILQDLIEIPNFYTRSSQYYLYLIQRYIFRLEHTRSPETAYGEKKWFLFYGLASLIYRLFIMITIALYLSVQYLFIGVALAIWALFMQIISPLMRGIRFLLQSPLLVGQRLRAGITTSTIITSIAALLFFMPVSLSTRTDGVVWVSDQAHIYVNTSGFVDQLIVPSDTWVNAGDPLLRMFAPELDARIEVLEAKKRELQLRQIAEQMNERVQSNITKEELTAIESELMLLRERTSNLIVKARTSGKFILPDEKTLQGLYFKQGALIAYIMNPEQLIVRAVIPQEDIGLVRNEVSSIQIRLAEKINETIDTQIIRETPAANSQLPSAALGATGGGNISVSKSDNTGRTAIDKYFQLDMSLPEGLNLAGLGERVYVRVNHGTEPLAKQWTRSIRQLLLSHLQL